MRLPTIAGTGNGGPPGTLDVDTGLTQVNQSFPDMSPEEPGFGVGDSRIQVVPMSPIPLWTNITHSEPFIDPVTGTIFVTFTNNGVGDVSNLNVLFWDPHSAIGPGEADTYG
jgi:hypothetical protein